MLTTRTIKTAHYNCVESAKLLLERDDINVNFPNSDGWTALHRACHEASLVEVVDLLLERDDIGINARDVDNWDTPACHNGRGRSIPIIPYASYRMLASFSPQYGS
jgi:ankyrin repeat protein